MEVSEKEGRGGMYEIVVSLSSRAAKDGWEECDILLKGIIFSARAPVPVETVFFCGTKGVAVFCVFSSTFSVNFFILF
jgi:hypothetical protein